MYIGYAELETLLQQYKHLIGLPNTTWPIYALSHTLPQPAGMGIMRYEGRVTVSFIDDGNHVHYWTATLGRLEFINGTPLTDDVAAKQAEQDRQADRVRARLGAHIVVEALVAVPKDLQLLDGKLPPEPPTQNP